MAVERIRLRARDTINKEMHYDFQFMYIVSGDEKEIESGIIFQSDIHKHNFDAWPPNELKQYRPVIMEWVNANDSMNIPIYEWDLLSVQKDGNDEWIGFVTWGTKGCAWVYDVNFDENKSSLHTCFLDQTKTSFTVVGNVFENENMISHLFDIGILKQFNT